MKTEIITVGTELLNGHKNDAHTAYLGRELNALGLQPRFSCSVSDDAGDIREALRSALARSELVFVCGGLGPTLDDITRDVAAEVAACPLAEDPALAEQLRQRFAARLRSMPENNLRQAQVPAGARVLNNPAGTAPGLVIPCRGEFSGKFLALLPGPPRELQAVYQEGLSPWLREKYQVPPAQTRSVMSWGLAESTVDELLRDLVPEGDTRSLAMLAHGTHVEVRLSSADPAFLGRLETAVLSRLGDYVFSTEGKSLELVVAELLAGAKATVAVAESCTGGRLAAKLTAIAGSSNFFKLGLVTYSDASKTQLLEVPPFVIKKSGAVSEETALAMAVGLSRKSGCDYCLSVTGIAGPGGGSAEKPVGLVYFALAAPEGIARQVFRFGPWTREQIQARAAQAGLFLLYRSLCGLPIPEEGSDLATFSRPAGPA
jgi:nicotinamide-nucleotide amidase